MDVRYPAKRVDWRNTRACTRLSVRYGDRAIVDSLSIEVGRGDVTGLSGESGCGKSTLLKCMADMLPPSASWTGQRELFGSVGYIPQEVTPSLSPYIRVLEQVARLAHSSSDATSILASVGLQDLRLLRSYPHQLSGGERQRVLVAQALAMKPDLILADEPTANLDSATEGLVLDLLHRYVRENRAGLLIVSHRERAFRRLNCRAIQMTVREAEPAGGQRTTGVGTDSSFWEQIKFYRGQEF